MSDAYRTDGMMIVPSGDGPKIENALESIACAIAFDVKDWSTSRRDAWIYAIVFGWDEAEESVARRHQWDAEDIERAHRLHKQWQQVSELIDSQQLADLPRWIPVTERLPETSGVYLAWMQWDLTDPDDKPSAYPIEYDDEEEAFGWWKSYFDPESLGWAGEEFIRYEGVTHWMPLPQPPKEASHADAAD